MTGNASKWMEFVVKGCIRAISAASWLRMAEMSRKTRKCIGNWRKWTKIARNGWARKFYVKYQCHVQSYAAAALAWEMPRRIRYFGIPLPNWRALLSRHQLGATRLTVDTRHQLFINRLNGFIIGYSDKWVNSKPEVWRPPQLFSRQIQGVWWKN